MECFVEWWSEIVCVLCGLVLAVWDVVMKTVCSGVSVVSLGGVPDGLGLLVLRRSARTVKGMRTRARRSRLDGLTGSGGDGQVARSAHGSDWVTRWRRRRRSAWNAERGELFSGGSGSGGIMLRLFVVFWFRVVAASARHVLQSKWIFENGFVSFENCVRSPERSMYTTLVAFVRGSVSVAVVCLLVMFF